MFQIRGRPLIKFIASAYKYSQSKLTQPLRSTKPKSAKSSAQHFVDLKNLRAVGGNGGDGCISFLQLWSNENAGPDGGDGGHGGHVIFEASIDVKDLIHVPTVIRAPNGDKGHNKDCHGKCGENLIIKLPIGTVVKNANHKVVGDLDTEGVKFVAARGGAGGKGNHFFITDIEQAPEICEYGAIGEDLEYTIELKCMAHVGLIGFPNAGKSTLLRAISRAKPKVAPYPFTTTKPYLGMVQYDDYMQVAVADLPGLIVDSHKNRGLGIDFLRHAERCMALLYVLDLSLEEPWTHLDSLQYELSQFSESLLSRPQLVIGNKIDLPESVENLQSLKEHTKLQIIPVSAKTGSNLLNLLNEIRILSCQ